ncbi:MAG: hypothetical protein WC465_05220 [Patescibacteria group bacterium]
MYFGLVTFFNLLWAITLIIFNLSNDEKILRLFASLPYTMAWLVIIFLFYFAVYFPYQLFPIKKIYYFLINIVSVLMVMYTVFGYKLFVLGVNFTPNHMANYDFVGYSIYAALMTLVILSSLIILIIKYKKAEGIFKTQLGLILISVIIGTIFGCYFNLFLMYIDNFSYIHLGPLFTLFINFIVFSFLVLPKEKIHG